MGVKEHLVGTVWDARRGYRTVEIVAELAASPLGRRFAVRNWDTGRVTRMSQVALARNFRQRAMTDGHAVDLQFDGMAEHQ
ncbi:hypothetical protein [Mycobacterium shimoidei]|nr:hypothetical protein [Mycobacterium shimoidei]